MGSPEIVGQDRQSCAKKVSPEHIHEDPDDRPYPKIIHMLEKVKLYLAQFAPKKVKTEQSRRAKSTDQMFAQFLPFIPN
jgi:hypothetical protein